MKKNPSGTFLYLNTELCQASMITDDLSLCFSCLIVTAFWFLSDYILYQTPNQCQCFMDADAQHAFSYFYIVMQCLMMRQHPSDDGMLITREL